MTQPSASPPPKTARRPTAQQPGRRKRLAQGWWAANRWLVARRLAQVLILALFLSGPLAGLWIIKGTLAASLTLGILPLNDPMIALQSLLAHHRLSGSVLVGAAVITLFYGLVGGRVFCAWVCPVNVVSDAAAGLRSRWRLQGGTSLDRRSRYGLLLGVMVASATTGTVAWEFLNPVSLLFRGLVFGSILSGGASLMVAGALFLVELAVIPRGWCSALCPVGAFYGLLGRFSLLRVSAAGRDRCDSCMECFAVCPERPVLSPALRPAPPTKDGDSPATPLILSGDCTNCGRCVDVCSENIFRFTHRFDHRFDHAASDQAPSLNSTAPNSTAPNSTDREKTL